MFNENKLAAVGGFVFGFASGVTLAFLYAPASGRDTREYIESGARQARDQTVSAAAKARELAERGRQAALSARDEFRSKVDATIADGRQTFEEGRETVSMAVKQGLEAYQRSKGGHLR